MKRRAFLVPLAGLAILAAAPCGAQEVARVEAIVRVVKAAPPGGTAFADARLGMPLSGGSRVRTGGRSKTSLRFSDKSVIHLDELTEVLVSGGRQRDARLLGGRLMGDFTRPGTVSGGYATAAVRGTKFIFFEDSRSRSAYLRCYDGHVFVSSPGIRMRAGRADAGSATTLTDDALVDDQTDWTDSTLRIVGGTNNGQERTITDFNPAAGTLTVAPAFPDAIDNTSEYIITSDARAPVVRLDRNEGTTVRDGKPSRSYTIAELPFAEGERYPWFMELQPGVSVGTFPNTLGQEIVEEGDWPTREGIDHATDQKNFGDPRQLERGNLEVIIPAKPQPQVPGSRLRTLLASAGPEETKGAGEGKADGKVLIESTLGGPVSSQRQANAGTGVWFRAEPFAVGSNEADSEGLHLRAQTVVRNMFVEVGGLVARLSPDNVARLSEGFYQWRTRSGDLIVGRQHLFIGPAHNLRIGSLLGFETMDAAVVRPALRGPFRAELGYIADTNPLFGQGFSGVYARGSAVVHEGVFAATVLTADLSHTQPGWSLDASYPVVRDQLDVYASGGDDPFRNRIVVAGFYLPGLYQATGFDLFTEYGDREGFRDRVQVRLRRDLGLHWLLVGFVDQRIGGDLDGGGGVQYKVRFP